jgi:hypothetical protein
VGGYVLRSDVVVMLSGIDTVQNVPCDRSKLKFLHLSVQERRKGTGTERGLLHLRVHFSIMQLRHLVMLSATSVAIKKKLQKRMSKLKKSLSPSPAATRFCDLSFST